VEDDVGRQVLLDGPLPAPGAERIEQRRVRCLDAETLAAVALAA